MKLGNKIILIILFSFNFLQAEQKITTTPLINIDKIKPSFEDLDLKDENNTRYLNRVEYRVIPIQDSDTIIRGQFGKTFSNLAFEAYGKTELWWIIARANNENRGSMYVVPGKEYRIPRNITNVLREFKELDK